ncbi:hypothetical protein AB0368_15890 [Actinoplanes sp. NPDC051475]|uniref:hypothetical protein n=1 Tax=Actinoplanes sp. NPDC051475 TaxID=3157225 RepID=UPI00344C816F
MISTVWKFGETGRNDGGDSAADGASGVMADRGVRGQGNAGAGCGVETGGPGWQLHRGDLEIGSARSLEDIGRRRDGSGFRGLNRAIGSVVVQTTSASSSSPWWMRVLVSASSTVTIRPAHREAFRDVRDRRFGPHPQAGLIMLLHADLHQLSAECRAGPDTHLSRPGHETRHPINIIVGLHLMRYGSGSDDP